MNFETQVTETNKPAVHGRGSNKQVWFSSVLDWATAQSKLPRKTMIPRPKECWKAVTRGVRLAMFCASLVLIAGCTGLSRTEVAELARHPARESRMSNRPEPGYVPTGVWRVRGVHNTVYLVSTSHSIPDDAVPFPSSFYAAYADSQIVYVEFDTDLSPWTQLRLTPRIFSWVRAHRDELVAPRGWTLTNYLSAETLEALRERYGRDFRGERITPSLLLMQQEMGALEAKDGRKPSGVEEPFVLLAHRDGKPLRELDDGEVVETALQALDQMLGGYHRDIARRGADAVVRDALLNGESESDAVWRRGDLAAATRVQEELKKESAELYDKVLRRRNRTWMSKLEPLLRGRKNAMVLVGAAHLPGEDGLLHLLRAAEFTVEQMYGVDRP